jgi:Mg/Co/Ni transporter MgtE
MPFLQLVKLSYKRWWRIFGNIILTGIIIGSVYSVVQQLLLWISGINDIIVYGVESFFQLEKP